MGWIGISRDIPLKWEWRGKIMLPRSRIEEELGFPIAEVHTNFSYLSQLP